jgi:hypothetical protein
LTRKKFVTLCLVSKAQEKYVIGSKNSQTIIAYHAGRLIFAKTHDIIPETGLGTKYSSAKAIAHITGYLYTSLL